jgi:hypothetical protein
MGFGDSAALRERDPPSRRVPAAGDRPAPRGAGQAVPAEYRTGQWSTVIRLLTSGIRRSGAVFPARSAAVG